MEPNIGISRAPLPGEAIPDSPAVDPASVDPAKAVVTEIPVQTSAPKVAIRNSLWCVHRTLGLGMVGEVGSVTTFHVEGEQGLGPAQNVQLTDLRPALASELPERLGYTPRQLEDLGYL